MFYFIKVLFLLMMSTTTLCATDAANILRKISETSLLQEKKKLSLALGKESLFHNKLDSFICFIKRKGQEDLYYISNRESESFYLKGKVNDVLINIQEKQNSFHLSLFGGGDERFTREMYSFYQPYPPANIEAPAFSLSINNLSDKSKEGYFNIVDLEFGMFLDIYKLSFDFREAEDLHDINVGALRFNSKVTRVSNPATLVRNQLFIPLYKEKTLDDGFYTLQLKKVAGDSFKVIAKQKINREEMDELSVPVSIDTLNSKIILPSVIEIINSTIFEYEYSFVPPEKPLSIGDVLILEQATLLRT